MPTHEEQRVHLEALMEQALALADMLEEHHVAVLIATALDRLARER